MIVDLVIIDRKVRMASAKIDERRGRYLDSEARTARTTFAAIPPMVMVPSGRDRVGQDRAGQDRAGQGRAGQGLDLGAATGIARSMVSTWNNCVVMTRKCTSSKSRIKNWSERRLRKASNSAAPVASNASRYAKNWAKLSVYISKCDSNAVN